MFFCFWCVAFFGCWRNRKRLFLFVSFLIFLFVCHWHTHTKHRMYFCNSAISCLCVYMPLFWLVFILFYFFVFFLFLCCWYDHFKLFVLYVCFELTFENSFHIPHHSRLTQQHKGKKTLTLLALHTRNTERKKIVFDFSYSMDNTIRNYADL